MSDNLNKLTELVEELSIRDEEIFKLKAELQDFFENNNVPMHQVSSEGIIIRANKAELDALGYTAEEYIGQPIAKFHDSQKLIGEILVKLINNEEIWQNVANIICKDGSLCKVSITSSRGSEGLTRCLSMPIRNE